MLKLRKLFLENDTLILNLVPATRFRKAVTEARLSLGDIIASFISTQGAEEATCSTIFHKNEQLCETFLQPLN